MPMRSFFFFITQAKGTARWMLFPKADVLILMRFFGRGLVDVG
jgi:hypothetical protein